MAHARTLALGGLGRRPRLSLALGRRRRRRRAVPALVHRRGSRPGRRGRRAGRRRAGPVGPVRPRPDRRPSARRLLVDLHDEYARHVGHADLFREAIDGLVGEDPPQPG
ncbi:mycothiol transferase [Nakamurella multipartita]|uniref:mycothiol transferase n=1 Tax=Nakamurella multipartita TaxID=53461 RepID=UPI003898E31C